MGVGGWVRGGEGETYNRHDLWLGVRMPIAIANAAIKNDPAMWQSKP